jgi:hypothetical protein
MKLIQEDADLGSSAVCGITASGPHCSLYISPRGSLGSKECYSGSSGLPTNHCQGGGAVSGGQRYPYIGSVGSKG